MSEALDVASRLLPSMALIVGMLLLLRRWAQRGAQQAGAGIKVLTRAGITRGATVAVVELGDRRFLVGASEHGVSLLAELDDTRADAPRKDAPGTGAPGTGAPGTVTTTADLATMLGGDAARDNRPGSAAVPDGGEGGDGVPVDVRELIEGAGAQDARGRRGGGSRLSVGDLLTHGRGGSDRPRMGAGAGIPGSGDGSEGLVDRLRAMTVRTHVGRPIRGNGM